jgi:hypothetical protein
MIRWAKGGAIAGAIYYGALLAVHVSLHGGVQARYGCVIGPEQRAINFPATIVEAIAPNPWVFPQRFGEPPPVGYPEPPTDRFSAPAWIATGLFAYAILGGFAGAALGAGAGLLARRRS